MLNEKVLDHPSFGQIEVTRCHCSGKTSLYGSSLSQHQTIRVTLYRSQLGRMLNKNWYHTKERLFEIEMSPTQWAEFISSMNIGGGVPCTIRIDSDGQVEPCPEIPTRQLFDSEFRETVEDSSKKINEAISICADLMNKKTLTKADRNELMEYLNQIKRNLTDAIPFIQQSFTEQMDKTVHEAKGEIEATKEAFLLQYGKISQGETEETKNNSIDFVISE